MATLARHTRWNTTPDDVLTCYASYMAFNKMKSPTKKQFVYNLKEKLLDEVFIGDTAALLRPGEDYNPEEAFDIVLGNLLDFRIKTDFLVKHEYWNPSKDLIKAIYFDENNFSIEQRISLEQSVNDLKRKVEREITLGTQ